MEIKKKNIYALDLIIVAGTLLAIIVLIGYSEPLVLVSFDNFETSNNSILFSFDKANVIYIDDNPEFTSPEKIYVKDNLVINLKRGVYYWKVEGVLQSEVKKITIQSEINLKLRDKGKEYEVVNYGNTRLKVDIYDNDALFGNVTLDIDKSANVSGTAFVGGEDE